MPNPSVLNPDLWELDQRYLEIPGRDRVMLDLRYDYRSNLVAYPGWQAYLDGRAHRRLPARIDGLSTAFVRFGQVSDRGMRRCLAADR